MSEIELEMWRLLKQASLYTDPTQVDPIGPMAPTQIDNKLKKQWERGETILQDPYGPLDSTRHSLEFDPTELKQERSPDVSTKEVKIDPSDTKMVEVDSFGNIRDPKGKGLDSSETSEMKNPDYVDKMDTPAGTIFLYLTNMPGTKDVWAKVVQRGIEEPVALTIIPYNEKEQKYFFSLFDTQKGGEEEYAGRMLMRRFLKNNSILTDKACDITFAPPEFTEKEKKYFGNPENVFDNLLRTDPLGNGGFRNVYDLGDFVLKVANNYNSFAKAREANQIEVNHQIRQEFPDLTVKTYKQAPDFAWIIQDKVEPLESKDEFYSFFPAADSPRYFFDLVEDLDNMKREDYEKKYDNLSIRFGTMVKKFDLSDLKPANFGKSNGNLVVFDLATRNFLRDSISTAGSKEIGLSMASILKEGNLK